MQFELDIEPRLNPSMSGGVPGSSLNESQDLSFSQAPSKGMQPLRETVSEIEMLTRAGKHLKYAPLRSHLVHSFSSSSSYVHSFPLLPPSNAAFLTSSGQISFLLPHSFITLPFPEATCAASYSFRNNHNGLL